MLSESTEALITSPHVNSTEGADTLFTQDIAVIKHEDNLSQSLETSPSPTQYRDMPVMNDLPNFPNTSNDDALSGYLFFRDQKDDISNLLISSNTDNGIETQMSITERSGNMTLSEGAEEANGNLLILSEDDFRDGVPRKARKHSLTESPSSYSSPTTTALSDDFDFHCASSSSQYTFTQFGSNVQGASKFFNNPTLVKDSISGPQSSSFVSEPEQTKGKIKQLHLNQPNLTHSRNGCSLIILNQPEKQHRARYQTEGSRGAIKDRDGNGYPKVKLTGYSGGDNLTLQIFIGMDSGKVKPHGFYQACPVSGKNQEHCEERTIDGNAVIEMPLEASNNYEALVDCVGILKLRNADVEKRVDQKTKRKSTKARLVFRVTFPSEDGLHHVTLQQTSDVISCTQPAGQPEVCKKSISSLPVIGDGEQGHREMFIIGKNFVKGTVVNFFSDDWCQQGKIDSECFHQNHMIITVPEYGNPEIKEPATVTMQIQSGGRQSDPIQFTFLPISMSESVQAMDTAISLSVNTTTPSCVSPEALEIQQQMLDMTKADGNRQSVLKHMLTTTSADMKNDTSTTSLSQPPRTVADLLLAKKINTRFNGNDEKMINVSNSLPVNNGVVTKQINGNPIVNSTVQLLQNNQILNQPPSQSIVIPPPTIVTSQQNATTNSQLIQSIYNSISGNTQTINTQLLNQAQQQQQQSFILTNSNTSNIPATPILIVPQSNQNNGLTQILQVLTNSTPTPSTTQQMLHEELSNVNPSAFESFLG